MLVKTGYFALCIFGTFHATKLTAALFTTALMGRFGKP
jgi:hypothetical protein